MAVNVEDLSMADFLTLLRYGGKVPAAPEFDSIRMTPQEWAALFPAGVQPTAPTEEGEADAGQPADPTRTAAPV